jgi:ubiquitin carboxyl-terminal hydrolase 5/13
LLFSPYIEAKQERGINASVGLKYLCAMDNQLGDHQEDDLALQLVSGRLQDLKVPTVHDRVYKDECMFCFATSESPGGLFINLQTLQAFDQEHILLDHQRTGTGLYLNEVARRVPLVVEKGQEDAQPEKLAIGVEGGFQLDKKTYEVEKDYAVVLVPEMLRVELPCPRLPEQVLAAIAAVQVRMK